MRVSERWNLQSLFFLTFLYPFHAIASSKVAFQPLVKHKLTTFSNNQKEVLLFTRSFTTSLQEKQEVFDRFKVLTAFINSHIKLESQKLLSQILHNSEMLNEPGPSHLLLEKETPSSGPHQNWGRQGLLLSILLIKFQQWKAVHWAAERANSNQLVAGWQSFRVILSETAGKGPRRLTHYQAHLNERGPFSVNFL